MKKYNKSRRYWFEVKEIIEEMNELYNIRKIVIKTDKNGFLNLTIKYREII